MDGEDFSDDEEIKLDWKVEADDYGISLRFQCPVDWGDGYSRGELVGSKLSFSEFANNSGFGGCLNFDDACHFLVDELEIRVSDQMEYFMPGDTSWFKEASYKEGVGTAKKEVRNSLPFLKMWMDYKCKAVAKHARKEALLRGVIVKLLDSKGKRSLSIDAVNEWRYDDLEFYKHLRSLFDTDVAVDRKRIEDDFPVDFDVFDFDVIKHVVSESLGRKRSDLHDVRHYGNKDELRSEDYSRKQKEVFKLEALERCIGDIWRQDSKPPLISSDYFLIYDVVLEGEKEILDLLCDILGAV